MSDPAADEEVREVHPRRTTRGGRAVMVTVDERHARAVRDILGMQAPAIMKEAPINVTRGRAILALDRDR